MNQFAQAIQERILLADGGLATEIYQRGFFINCSYDQLTMNAEAVIREIHHAFADAGAEVLCTNTFGANRINLNAYGISDQVDTLNRKAVELAREVATDQLYVSGTIGPVNKSDENPDWPQALAEQAAVLCDAGADLVTLSAFCSLEDLKAAYAAVAGACGETPVLPTLTYDALLQHRDSIPALLDEIRGMGATLFGIEGGDPEDLLAFVPALVEAAGDSLNVSFRPSAGRSKVVEGRTLYMASPEYMAEYTRRFVQKGAHMIGGDAGITPPMIKEMSSFLRSVQPRQATHIEVLETPDAMADALPVTPLKERTPWGTYIDDRFAISVELDPPKGLDATKSLEGAKFLYENGIEAVNIADGPRASGRMSPTALATLVRQVVPIETIVHVCCRDRNLLALQMDLISANALGLKNLMLITGDPPKMGIYPDATPVFDLDAIGLVRNANLLNHGLDFACRPLKSTTNFVLGVGCNPGAPDLDREVKRYEEKVQAGAEFVFSQPVYDPEYITTFLDRIKHVKPIPFFVGILPLASSKNAEFLHTQVPGMQIPDEIRKRMRMASSREEQRAEGIEIAAEALREAARHPMVKGSYIFPPFGRYQSILDVLEKSGVR